MVLTTDTPTTPLTARSLLLTANLAEFQNYTNPVTILQKTTAVPPQVVDNQMRVISKNLDIFQTMGNQTTTKMTARSRVPVHLNHQKT